MALFSEAARSVIGRVSTTVIIKASPSLMWINSGKADQLNETKVVVVVVMLTVTITSKTNDSSQIKPVYSLNCDTMPQILSFPPPLFRSSHPRSRFLSNPSHEEVYHKHI